VNKYISDIYEDKAYHWLMFMKTKNGFYLRKEALKISEGEDNSDKAFTCYCKINDQVIKDFGQDESFLKYIENEEKIAFLKLDYIINKNGFSQTLYEIEEQKKQERAGDVDEKDFDLNKEIGYISKYIGGGILNIKEITIHQYLTAKTVMKNG
jgi:hypothetical protein